MRITGIRVKCANCGMIYEKPPAEQAHWIGVPFRVEGIAFCPKCGSNAADECGRQEKYVTSDTSNTTSVAASDGTEK